MIKVQKNAIFWLEKSLCKTPMLRKRKTEIRKKKHSINSFFVFPKKRINRSTDGIFSIRRKRTKKSNFKFKISNFKASLKDKISNLKLPKLRFKNFNLKRSTALITLLATIATVYFQFIPQSQGASYTWNQTSWTSQTANNPVHVTNATGWSEYAAKDANIAPVNGGADIELTEGSYTATDDGVFSTTGIATGGDFDNGTHTNTQVVGVDAAASVQINTGTASTTKTSDTDFSTGTHSGTTTTGSGDGTSITLPGTLTAQNVTHTADTDFTGTHTSTEVSGTGDAASVQLQAAQTSGTYESQTIDFGAGAANADYQTATISQTAGAGTVNMAWGSNANGQLGDDTTTQRNTPVQTLNMTDVVAVSAGKDHYIFFSLSLKSDGTVWAWGSNSNGQLGDNTTTERHTPVQVKDTAGTGWLTNIVDISAGSRHSLALKSDGTVWAWGANNNGQLGDNTTTQRLTPVQVKGPDGVGFLTDVVAIASGGYYPFSIALKSDGTVWAWGENTTGQLGNNSLISKTTPAQVVGPGGSGYLTDIVAISAGQRHCLALKSDGTVWAWGHNQAGQLGDNTAVQRKTPVQVLGPGGAGFLTDVVAINGSSYESSLALKSDGTVWAWGMNEFGILGDGTNIVKYVPVQVKGLAGVGFLTNVVMISAGQRHALALKSDGTVWAWGRNTEGQIGDNTTAHKYTPVQVLGSGGSGYLTGITSISAGASHSLAIKGGTRFQIAAKDTDADWTSGDYKPMFRPNGSAARAVISNGSDGKRYVRYKADLVTPDSAYTPKLNSLTINTQNVGSFTSGAIDLGAAYQFTGRRFSFGTTIPTEIAGNRVQVKLSRDGINWYGSGGTTGIYYDSFSCTVASGTYTCDITDATAAILNGTSNLYFKIFLNTSSTAYLPTFDSITFNYHLHDSGTFESATIDLGGGADLKTVSINQNAGGGALGMAWGRNNYGQLGDGTTNTRVSPISINGLSGVVAITASVNNAEHTLALKSDGTVWAWGSNSNGQLGDNTTTQRLTPVQVLGPGGTGYLTDVVAIAAGFNHSLALKSDGTVWAWGYNQYGQLGDNTITQRNTPVQVLGPGGSGYLTEVTEIITGDRHSLALKSDGTVWTWGYNNNGQLGDNTTAHKYTPVQVLGSGGSGYLTDIMMIAAGSYHSLVLKSNGTVWAWGSNSNGQLGDNTTTNRYTPVQVLGSGGTGFLADISIISSGDQYSFALKDDDTVWTWGYNANGRLGDGTSVDKYTPVQVVGVGGVGYLTDVVNIAGGTSHSLALKSDGTSWAWGWNGNGEFGNGTITHSTTPVQSSINNVNSISGGYLYSLAIRGGIQIKMAAKDIDSGWQESDFKLLAHQDGSTRLIIPNEFDNKRYIRYKAEMFTADATYTPALNSLTLNYDQYSPSQTLTSSAFNSTDVANTPAKLEWAETLPANTDVKFQVRTSANGTDWTNWCGPDDGVPGSCNSATYFTDPTGTEEMDDLVSDQTNDQYIQYQATLTSPGTSTPTLSDVTMTYVVNATPEVQGVSASQGTDGIVTVNYEVRDADSSTGTTPDQVTATLQYCSANCSDAGNETWTDATTVTGDGLVSADEVNWTAHQLTWTAKTDYPGIYNNTDFKVRIKIDDSELANNLAYDESLAFTLDTKNPTNVGLSIDHTKATEQLTLTTPSDDSNYQMLVSNLSNFAGATPEAFVSPYTFTLTDDPATVYLRIIDEYGNYTDVSGTTPAKVQGLVYYDTSNSSLGEYREFLAWGVVSALQVGNGFASYDIYRSEDNVTFTYLGQSTDRTLNYYIDDTVLPDVHYYYKMVIVDINGNTSDYSATVDDIPDGQGGTDSTPPTISDVTVSNINTTSAKVTWTTDELSDSSVGYSTNTEYLPERGLASMVTEHEIILTNLVPDTTYNIRVKSHDQIGNLGQNDKDAPGSSPIPNFTFATHPGPAISGVTIPNISNNRATITWQTTTNSSTYVVYSDTVSAGELVDPIEIGTPDLIGGEAPYAHTQELTELTENTTYYFYVKSVDASDNVATDNNGGNFYELLTTQDSAPPVISAVSAPIKDDVSAAIYWATDEPATSIVDYGTATGTYDQQAQVLTYDRSHYVILTGLEPETTYYYTVTSADINTNESVSEEYSFTTLDEQFDLGEVTEGDVLRNLAGPVVSGVKVSDITGESATVTWNTDYAASSLVKYGITEEYGSMAGNDLTTFDITKYATSHSVIINGLVPNTKYYYVVASVDEVGNIGQSSQATFTTASPSTLSSIKVISETLKEAIVSWVTSKKTTSVLEYGLTEEYGEKKESTSFTQEHSIALTGLESGTVYHFRVKGKDELNNLYSSGDYTFEPKSPPQISGFSAKDITERTAKIEFTTNVPTDVNITYTDPQNENNSGSQGNPTFTTKHSIELKNLASGREFSLKIRVRDELGNEIEEEMGSFKTVTDENPPQIEQVKTDSALTQSDKVQTIISWITDEPSTSKLIYKEGMSGEEKETTVSSELTTKNSAVFTIFKPGTVYYFKVKSIDESENETISQEYALLTPRRRENIIQIIIANFEDIFQWTNM